MDIDKIPEQKPEHYMTSKEVAEYFQLNIQTIYRLRKKGKLPTVKIGGSVRYKREDIDNAIREHKSENPQV